MSQNGNRPRRGAETSVGVLFNNATELTRQPDNPQDLAASNSLADHAAEIRRLGKRVVADVVEIGHHLSECKAICGHGNWLPWLDREFGWTDKTAENYINVYKLGGKFENFSNLDLPLSGLYLLAAPSTPDEARDAIIERAQAGETVSVADVKQTIEEVRRGIVTGVAMHPYAERGVDLYQTPGPATRALLAVEALDGPIWEPANGRGAISRELRARGYRVVATDLVDYGVPDARGGVDFLQQAAAPDDVTTVLTNPPYMYADEFVRHALKLVPRVVLLLRLAFLEGIGRSDIIDGGQLARVHVFRNRVQMMHRDGWEGPHASSALALAWFVWHRDHRGPTELHRISWEADSDEAPPPAVGSDAPPDDIPQFLIGPDPNGGSHECARAPPQPPRQLGFRARGGWPALHRQHLAIPRWTRRGDLPPEP